MKIPRYPRELISSIRKFTIDWNNSSIIF
jgi:hypothetical protein